VINLGLLLSWASSLTVCAQSFATPAGGEMRPVAPAGLVAQNWPAAAAPLPQPASARTVAAAEAAPKQETPLPPPSRRVDPLQTHTAAGAKPHVESHASPLPSLFTLGTSLAIVLGLFLTAAWLLRKTGAVQVTLLPKEVLEVLGRAPLAARQQVHLLRCGKKLLLVSVTAAGVETLTEITDPPEVDRLAGLCQQARPDSASKVFRQVFQQFAQPQRSRRHAPTALEDDLELAAAGTANAQREIPERRHV
jgi:flagellar biogenesis protein FliO